MKILIISDTHRNLTNLETILDRVKPIDRLIHLGDAEGQDDMIAEMAGCPMDIVLGNNDFFSCLEKEKELEIGQYKILITHGHYYYVNMGLADIAEEGRARGMDIVMFGHTHRPLIEIEDDIVILNPGSVSYPRQEGKRPSYIIMELDENGEARFELEYL